MSNTINDLKSAVTLICKELERDNADLKNEIKRKIMIDLLRDASARCITEIELLERLRGDIANPSKS